MRACRELEIEIAQLDLRRNWTGRIIFDKETSDLTLPERHLRIVQ